MDWFADKRVRLDTYINLTMIETKCMVPWELVEDGKKFAFESEFYYDNNSYIVIIWSDIGLADAVKNNRQKIQGHWHSGWKKRFSNHFFFRIIFFSKNQKSPIFGFSKKFVGPKKSFLGSKKFLMKNFLPQKWQKWAKIDDFWLIEKKWF